MNTDITLRPSTLASFVPEDAFADTLGFVSPPRISMASQRFNVLDENGTALVKPDTSLLVILLAENDVRVYRSKNEDGSSTYDPDNPLPPDCYSDDRIAPSEGAVSPQSPLCSTCPRAMRDQPAFKGPTLVSACKDQFKVAVLVAGQGEKVFLLTIGPASRKAYAAYRNFLKAHHAKPAEVVTKLDYADKAFQFFFEMWADSPRIQEMVKKVYSTDEAKMVVGAFERLKALPAPKPETTFVHQTIVEPDGQWKTEMVAKTVDPKVEPKPASFDVPVESPKHDPQFDLPPPKRRGRPPKDDAVYVAVSTPPPSAPAPKNNGGFGMQTPEPVSADMQRRLDEAFGR